MLGLYLIETKNVPESKKQQETELLSIMSEEFYNSGTNQDEDFDYSPINRQNSTYDPLNDHANTINNGGETSIASAAQLTTPTNEVNKRSTKASFPIKAVICTLVAIFIIGCLLKLFIGDSRENIVYEAARMAPCDSIALITVDLREERNLNNLFGGLLQGIAGNSVLKNRINQVLPNEISFDFVKDLALHAEGAGAMIARLPNDENPGLYVYMQKFKPKAPIEQTMKKFQELIVKKNPGLKYATIPTLNGYIHCPSNNDRGFSWIVQGTTLFVGTSGQDLSTILADREKEDSLLAEPGFQKYIGKIDRDSLSIGFVNFKRLHENDKFTQIIKSQQVDMRLIRFVKSMQYGFFKSKIERSKAGKQIGFSAQLVCDPKQIGYAKHFLNKANNVEFKSLKYHPSNNSSLVSVNLKTVWKIAYDLMGLTSEGKKQRQMPDEMLRRVGSSMDKLLNMLTGELTISIDGLSRLQGEQFVSTATSNPYKITRMPIVVTLGLKNSGDFEGFLLSLPSVPMLAAMCPSYDINSYRVYKIPVGKNTFLTITDEQLVAAFNMENQTVFDDMLSDKSEKTWAKVPLIERAAQENKLRGVFFSCEDIKANREDSAAGIKSRLSSALPGDKDFLKVFCQTLENMGHMMGYGYSVLSLQEDGCLMDGVAEMKKNGVPVDLDPKEEKAK